LLTVFSPAGRVLETHPLAVNRPSNVCFGGFGMRTVFVTSICGQLLKAQTDQVGWVMYPSDVDEALL
jgi:sugar lactone lactonase YvrE